jgi:hypothetical protein
MTRKNVQNISFFFAVIDTSPKINNFLPLLFIHLMTILPLPHKYFVTNIEDKKLNHTQGHIVIDVRRVGFDMSRQQVGWRRCNKKGHKTKELSQQV